MNAASWLRSHLRQLLIAAAASALILLIWGIFAPGLAIGGWIVGLLFWMGIALGALIMLAVHALTGGYWLDSLRSVLMPAAATLPVFGLLALPLIFDPHAVFPWVADPSIVRQEAVLRWYLNLPGFMLRGAVALIGWSVLAMLLLRTGARRPAVGAAALIFHAVAMTAIGFDWVLSLDPRFRSTVFGAAMALIQVLAALSWCAVLRPEPPGGQGKAGDLAQMLISAALGSVYLGFAQYLVSWYGNLPGKAEWFLPREAAPWVWLEGFSIALSTLLPIGGLLPAWMRRNPGNLSIVGLGVLIGVLLHLIWLVGPRFGSWAILSAALGTVAIGGAWLGLALGPVAARLERSADREVPHGA